MTLVAAYPSLLTYIQYDRIISVTRDVSWPLDVINR